MGLSPRDETPDREERRTGTQLSSEGDDPRSRVQRPVSPPLPIVNNLLTTSLWKDLTGRRGDGDDRECRSPDSRHERPHPLVDIVYEDRPTGFGEVWGKRGRWKVTDRISTGALGEDQLLYPHFSGPSRSPVRKIFHVLTVRGVGKVEERRTFNLDPHLNDVGRTLILRCSYFCFRKCDSNHLPCYSPRTSELPDHRGLTGRDLKKNIPYLWEEWG